MRQSLKLFGQEGVVSENHDTFIQENYTKEVHTEFDKRFSDYHNLFENFTSLSTFKTNKLPVISVIISKGGDRTIALLKQSDEVYVIIHYDVATQCIVNEMEIKGTYIKADNI